jgi:hypothetical protein
VDTFNGLASLQELYLWFNRLSGELDVNVFKDLNGVLKIDLSKNNLTTIDKATFHSQTVLELLDLSGNAFNEVVDPKEFTGLNPLCKVIV